MRLGVSSQYNLEGKWRESVHSFAGRQTVGEGWKIHTNDYRDQQGHLNRISRRPNQSTISWILLPPDNNAIIENIQRAEYIILYTMYDKFWVEARYSNWRFSWYSDGRKPLLCVSQFKWKKDDVEKFNIRIYIRVRINCKIWFNREKKKIRLRIIIIIIININRYNNLYMINVLKTHRFS